MEHCKGKYISIVLEGLRWGTYRYESDSGFAADAEVVVRQQHRLGQGT
jgi:hypothetical protein